MITLHKRDGIKAGKCAYRIHQGCQRNKSQEWHRCRRPVFSVHVWLCHPDMAMGVNPVPPVNIPIPTKIDYNGWCTYPKMVPLVLTHGHINKAFTSMPNTKVTYASHPPPVPRHCLEIGLKPKARPASDPSMELPGCLALKGPGYSYIKTLWQCTFVCAVGLFYPSKLCALLLFWRDLCNVCLFCRSNSFQF